MSTKIMSTPSSKTINTESPTIGCTPSSTHTPLRHNYAATHTPIASAKRPRQPITRAVSSNDGISSPMVSTPSVSKLNIYTPSSSSRQQEQPLSPMHPPRPVPVDAHGVIVSSRSNGVSESPETTSPESIISGSSSSTSMGSSSSWVGRKVDAIFSPVLNFLNGKSYHNLSNNKSSENDITYCEYESHETTLIQSSIKDDPLEWDDRNAENVLHVSHNTDPESCKNCEVSVNCKTERISLEKVNSVCLDSSLSDASISLEVEVESTSDVEDIEDQEEEFNPYIFIKSLPCYSLVVPNPSEKICLPPKSSTDPRISLVLDLDETLVHCTVEPISDANMIFPVNFHGMDYTVYVRLRPHLKEFLEAIRGKYEVIVFTASQQAYADALLNRIDPRKYYFDLCYVFNYSFIELIIVIFSFFYREEIYSAPSVSRVLSLCRRKLS